MKVLVLGSGAKDAAIAWWFSKSRLIEELYVAPANPGTRDYAINLDKLNPSDKEQVLEVCKKHGIDLVFIGTEAPLICGVIDYLAENGIKTCGTPMYAMKLESDRIFSREFAKKYKIPMPDFNLFKTEKELQSFLKKNAKKTFTIKPNALSPSRVIVNSSDFDVIMSYAKEHFKSADVILEDYIEGMPVTFTMFLDEKGHLDMPLCSEYSRREHSDSDIITGGMGSVCPVPLNNDSLTNIYDKIINPTLKGMKKEKLLYRGVLTFSIMLNGCEPYLVDYHVRLNDPATQTFAVLVKNDLCEIMNAMNSDTLSDIQLETTGNSSVGVVIASSGYPSKPKTGCKIQYSSYPENNSYMFFGAVSERGNGLFTNGGRIATIVGIADNILNANSTAYGNIDSVKFNGSWYREDIGSKFFSSTVN